MARIYKTSISALAFAGILGLPGCAPSGGEHLEPASPAPAQPDPGDEAQSPGAEGPSARGAGPGRRGITPPAPPEAERHQGFDIESRAEGQADLLPPPVEATRTMRRMDLDQLSASIRRVTGGVGWTERRNNVDVDLFESLSGTLGKADYVEITAESLEPSALFQKFLADAARQVCAEVTTLDADRPRGERVLTPAISLEGDAEPEVDANLRALLVRFHGQHVPPGDPVLEEWKWLFQSVMHLTDEPTVAWNAICVGLITHPDFYTY
ncbi:MAG: hypothetical protein ACE366_29725 [Bradymonadia bacterium]